MHQAPRRPRGARRRTACVRQPLLRRSCRRRGSVLKDGPRILGVDPGSRRAGWAVIVGSSQRPQLAEYGTIDLARGSFSERLAGLYDAMTSIVSRHAPTEAAVEAPFHGVSARSALQLAHARGVVLAAVGRAGIPVFEYAPAMLKKAVTGQGRAEKAQVQAMVRRLVTGCSDIPSTDASDAMAAALCHLFASGLARSLRAAAMPSRRSPREGRSRSAW